MTHASCKTTIDMPADAIWQVLSDFGAACQDLVIIGHSVLGKFGNAVAAVRKPSVAASTLTLTSLDLHRRFQHHLIGAIRRLETLARGRIV